MNQQIDRKVIAGIIAAVVVVLGVVIYRSMTAPSTGGATVARKTTVAPPTQPTESDLKKMREARNAR